MPVLRWVRSLHMIIEDYLSFWERSYSLSNPLLIFMVGGNMLFPVLVGSNV